MVTGRPRHPIRGEPVQVTALARVAAKPGEKPQSEIKPESQQNRCQAPRQHAKSEETVTMATAKQKAARAKFAAMARSGKGKVGKAAASKTKPRKKRSRKG